MQEETSNLSYVSELLGYKTRTLESAAQKQGTYYEYWGAASSESAAGAAVYGKCRYNFPTYEIFLDYAKRMIASGRPITISWAPGSGHWETIIGIDDMGTPEIYDDVVILGDSHDGRDQYFDGYNTYPAEMFYFQWYNGTNSLGQAHICIENTYDNMK